MKRWVFLAALVLLLGAPAAVLANGDDGGGDGDDNFLLGGTAQHAQDPENPSNDVIKIDTTSPDPLCAPPTYQNCRFGTVSRTLNVKIHQLDNMLEAKWYFQFRSCGGGSPRFQLAIDLDGDGQSNGNAFGYFGAPSTVGCPPNIWEYEDLTDLLLRWDLSQLAGVGEITPAPPYQVNWDTAELLIGAFPNHKVCTGALVDDSGWMPAAEGVAYYDIISIGRATWEDRGDTAGRGFATGCGAPRDDDDDDDDDDDGDHDRDGDDDGDDDDWDDERDDRWGDDD